MVYKRTFGRGLNKEEREKVECLFNYDELWEWLGDQGIEEDRIERLQGRISTAIKKATDEEAIGYARLRASQVQR